MDIKILFTFIYFTFFGYDMYETVDTPTRRMMAINISYPSNASTSEIIVLFKTHKELQYLSTPTVLAMAYELIAYHGLYGQSKLRNCNIPWLG